MAIDSVNFGLRLPQNWYDIGRLTSTLVEDSRLHEVAEWLRNFLSSMGHDSFTVKIGRVLPHLLFKGLCESTYEYL